VAICAPLDTGERAGGRTIAHHGDRGCKQAEHFFFWKPSLAATFQPSATLQLRAGLRRTVGQLNFNDFAASANVEDDRLLAGNPDLGPDSVWRGSFTADYRLPSGFAFNLEAFHEWRSDVLEQIVLPSGVAGLANAGSARVWGAQINGALPLKAVLPGGLIEVASLFRDASFDDPVTGENRRVTGLINPIITVNFRQDLTAQRFAWGMRYEPPRFSVCGCSWRCAISPGRNSRAIACCSRLTAAANSSAPKCCAAAAGNL
jgi:outer membrane receptor protein involved in Fe transport